MDNHNKRKKSKINNRNKKKKLKQDTVQQMGRLEQDTYEYFSRIADILKEKVDEEEIAILATNTLQQTQGIELDVCNHTIAASVVETLIPHCSWSQLKPIIEALDCKNERSYVNCECRLEEALIKDTGRRLRLEDSEEKDECLQYLISQCENLLNNFENYIWDLNFNYMIRTCLIVCSGFNENGLNLMVISKIMVKNFTKKTMGWNELLDCYDQDLISGYLQILLFTTKSVSEKSCNKFARYLLENCFLKRINLEKSEDSKNLEQFENVSWARLLEAVITVASPEFQLEIYQKLFEDKIETLIVSKKGHFSICKLIKVCSNKCLLENIMEKLTPIFGDILNVNNLNALLALSEACLSTGERQGVFVKNLIAALGCSGPNKEKHVINCIISMKSFSFEASNENITINYHGSLILQNLFKFKKPLQLVEAFLSLNLSTLKIIMTDSKGCHISDAFMTSTNVGVKSKDRLINSLKGYFSDLAVDKYGSRSFDALWNNTSMKNRMLILSEMSRQILRTQYGSIIASKIGLEIYLRDKNSWEKYYNRK